MVGGAKIMQIHTTMKKDLKKFEKPSSLDFISFLNMIISKLHALISEFIMKLSYWKTFIL